MQKENYLRQERIADFSILKFLLCVLGTLAAAFVSSYLSKIRAGYAFIAPSWTPDENVIMLGWALCAVLTGWSLYLVVQRRCPTKTEHNCKLLFVSLWVIHAGLAFAWPIILLTTSKIAVAFVWIAVLDGIVTALFVSALRLRGLSAILLLPYLATLLVATYFNLQLIMLN